MFRIAKQLEISRRIRQCQTAEELLQWLNVINNHTINIKLIDLWLKIVEHEICLEEGKRIVSNEFINCKSQFDNQAVDKLLTSGITQVELQSNHVYTGNSIRQLDCLSNGVLGHVSLYLPIESNLNLSITSHSFHKKIQNDQCLGSKDQKWNTITLNSTMLDVINKNNCIVQCMHKCTQIEIIGSHCNLHCSNCALSRLIHKINYTKNCDLVWFKYIWSFVRCIFVSNDYRCALQHIPIPWILEQAAHHQFLIPISVIGAPENMRGQKKLNHTIVKNFAKRVKSYINDNPDKIIRQIQQIWYDRTQCDMVKIRTSFGNNLTGIRLQLPAAWDDDCRFQDLETFFKIFHENLNFLLIDTDYNCIGNFNIESELFNNNKQLCDDLEKTENQLPFGKFLTKYNCQNKCLPQISHLEIIFGDVIAYQKPLLFKLLNHDKLMKLLNLQGSLKWLSMRLGNRALFNKRNIDIENLIELAISKHDNLEGCCYRLYTAGCLINYPARKKFFHLANATLLQMAIKPTLKYVYLVHNPSGSTQKKIFKYTVKIKSKNELLQSNRHLLRKKISSTVDDSIEDAKQIWQKDYSVQIKHCFQIERDYSV